MPIFLPGGSFFGTLCAIDPRPAKLNSPEIIGLFKNFAQLIAFHLDAQERAARQEAALLGERETAELREQFIAVLGHDLRNPLASIEAGARLLLRQNLDEKSVAILGQLQKSTSRMAALIGDMLDFARGRLGGGFALNRNPACRLGPVLEQVVDELRTAWPGRAIETTLSLKHPVDCDPARIAQLLSNLAGNALKHGTGTVGISAGAANGIFELAVENEGEPIPRHVSERLFCRSSALRANPAMRASASASTSRRKSPARMAAPSRSSRRFARRASRFACRSAPARRLRKARSPRYSIPS